LDGEKGRGEKLAEVLSAANSVIAQVDTQDLALHFGVNVDEDDPKAVKRNTEYENKKAALVDALARKARALSDLQAKAPAAEGKEGEAKEEAAEKSEAAEADKAKTPPSPDSVEGVLAELAKWATLDEVRTDRQTGQTSIHPGFLWIGLKMLMPRLLILSLSVCVDVSGQVRAPGAGAGGEEGALGRRDQAADQADQRPVQQQRHP
jgi:hypothetical protein